MQTQLTKLELPALIPCCVRTVSIEHATTACVRGIAGWNRVRTRFYPGIGHFFGPGPGIRVQRLENTGPNFRHFWHEILGENYPDPQDLVATASFSARASSSWVKLHFEPGTSQSKEEHSWTHFTTFRSFENTSSCSKLIKKICSQKSKNDGGCRMTLICKN